MIRETYEQRLLQVLSYLMARYPYGYTTAQLKAITGWESREVAGLLRSLASDGLVEQSDYRRPSLWWATRPALRMSELLEAPDAD